MAQAITALLWTHLATAPGGPWFRGWVPMAPGGRREGGHGAWVKKAPAGGEKKDEEVDFKGREGKGKSGRSKGERGSRREDDHEAKGKGRAKGKHKKEEGRESNSGEEETEDGGNALLKMLKGNAQTTKRFSYSKAELLKIATLPAANVKPPDLDPIVDKDNKDSVLLIRIATNREKEEHEPNGEDRRRANPTRQARTEGEARGEVAEAAEAERPAEEEDDEEKAQAFEKWLVRNMPKLEAAKADLTAKAAAASAGTGASASTGSSMTAAAPKWPPTASAMAAAMAAAGKSGSASTYMSMLQQQAGAGAAASGMSPAHAMQAAAYMQAMTQMQLAAARNSYSSQTWNAYNQYLNPYMTGAYGAGYGMDPFTAAAASQAAASNLTEAMQAKLGLGALNQQRMAAMKAAATAKAAKATAKAKAAKAPGPKTPPAKAGPKTSPLTAPVPAPAVAGLLPKTSAPSSPQLQPAGAASAAAAPAVPPAAVPAASAAAAPAALDGLKAPGKSGEEEDEAGCSQS